MHTTLKLLIFIMALTTGQCLLGQTVTSLTLINANTNEPIFELEDEQVIDLLEVGNALNIRANTEGNIGSVKFVLDGQDYRTEGVAPYALAGDNNGDYNAWSPTPGEHTIQAIAYAEGGGVGGSVTVTVNFKESTNEIVVPTEVGTGDVTISGELRKWHKVTLDFDGPEYSETDNDPNPFLDFRLMVTFSHGDRSFEVPGYFASDGNSAETSASSGNVWRVHFAPNETGEWTYEVSFRIGRNIAVSDDPEAGEIIESLDGVTGSFTIDASDKTGRDFRGKGRLEYVGERYLRFAETGNIFIKGGPDAPENFLAYDDFDNTPDEGGRRKSWSAHADDWQSGDPSWQNGKGTEIIGAINYLAAEGLNAFSFLTMNIGGDDKNVFPYLTTADFRHFDCSKLDQWEVVFNHADKLGLYLHFKTQETENDQLLDGGDLGTNRKLYYRELIARFSHHLALNWNLGEENTQTAQQRKDMAAYFSSHDPYQNHIVLHTYPDQQDQVYPALLGEQSALTGVSIQKNWNKVHEATLKWIEKSRAAGKAWVVANDEQGNANTGVPDDTFTGTPSLDGIRQQTLWGNLMAGGAGVEYYFGYQLPHSDLTCQDYRSRDISWDYVKIAIEFFSSLPLKTMHSHDELVTEGWCLADEGRTYLVYLPSGGATDLNVNIAGQYKVQWFDPRSGGEMLEGDIQTVEGKGAHTLGNPPYDTSKDWAVMVTREATGENTDPIAELSADQTSGTAPLLITFDASSSSDSDGTITSYDWDFGDGITGSGVSISHTFERPGNFEVKLTVYDDNGGFDIASTSIEIGRSAGCGADLTINSVDFDHDNSAFYVDNFTGTQLLAIVPNEDTGEPVTASVSTIFEGESCNYDITLHGVGESDGQAVFSLLINGISAGSFQLPLSDQDWEMGEAFNHVFENLSLENGDEITVEGSTASSDGKEWSRARWLKLELKPSVCEDAGTFEEANGYVVFEAENTNPLGEGWTITNSFDESALGEGHLEYTGSNSLGSVPHTSITEYKIKITTPGTYQFKWRSRNGAGAVKFDEENDSWLNIEASEFYGTKGGTKHVFGSNDFIKVWIQDLNQWSWNCFGEHHGINGMNVYATFNNPGVYSLKIAGRSHGHPIDRIALFQSDKASIAMDDATTESAGVCGNTSISKIWASPVSYGATLVSTPIIIDGLIDQDWQYVESMQIAYESSGNELPDIHDLSADFKIAYDEEHLYLLASISDDSKQPDNTNASDAGDQIELFFNPDGEHNDLGAYGADALFIRLKYGTSNNPIAGSDKWTNAQDHAGFQFTTIDTDSGYILEASIPWANISADMLPDPNSGLGFEIQVNDDDGSGHESSIGWANNTGSNLAYEDTRKFGELKLKPLQPQYEPKTAWEVIYVDSEDGLGNSDLAIDGDEGTFWHTEWRNAQPGFPHELHIDFKETLNVSEVHYLHRQDAWGPNGAIGKYQVYVSEDKEAWGEPAAEGELNWPVDLATNYKLRHVIELAVPKKGRYMRFVALSETQNLPDEPYTAIAELDVVTFKGEAPLTIANSTKVTMEVYPNPGIGAPIHLRFSQSGRYDLKLTDITGRLLLKTTLMGAHYVIDSIELNPGVYAVSATYRNKTITKKIIIGL